MFHATVYLHVTEVITWCSICYLLLFWFIIDFSSCFSPSLMCVGFVWNARLYVDRVVNIPCRIMVVVLCWWYRFGGIYVVQMSLAIGSHRELCIWDVQLAQNGSWSQSNHHMHCHLLWNKVQNAQPTAWIEFTVSNTTFIQIMSLRGPKFLTRVSFF